MLKFYLQPFQNTHVGTALTLADIHITILAPPRARSCWIHLHKLIDAHMCFDAGSLLVNTDMLSRPSIHQAERRALWAPVAIHQPFIKLTTEYESMGRGFKHAKAAN